MKDLSVPAGTRIKVIDDICAQAKFADITRNFLGMISFHVLFCCYKDKYAHQALYIGV
jgi:hypothetical protein